MVEFLETMLAHGAIDLVEHVQADFDLGRPSLPITSR